jgi:hypothetical protein
MNKLLFFTLVVLVACKASQSVPQQSFQSGSADAFIITKFSDDPTYGYTSENAIKVGGSMMEGPKNERKFLNALAGPNGEEISYARDGSCCPVESENGFGGYAMLDIYSITYKGISKPIKLYINMYDPGELLIPVGFTIRKF